MAINRRARAEVRSADTDFCTVRTIGHIDGDWKFRVREDETLEWLDRLPPAGGLDLLHEAWRTGRVADKLDISLDTAAFLDSASRRKLGLGSSAALTAALITALFEVTNTAGDPVMEAIAAHRRLQGGRGSGVDVATSFNGGVIEYRMQEPGACNALSWPEGLEYAVLWSGKPSSTAEKLKKFDESTQAGNSGSTAELCNASEEIARSWSVGGTLDLLETLRRYTDTLMQFDVDHDLGIFDAGHRELVEVAAKRNLVYKPCGAGGGDTGIIFATDEQAVADFTNFVSECGYQVLDVSLEMDGARLES
jgi:phosphomevalonate kinase